MYLHIGGDVAIHVDQLVGIFDWRIGESANTESFFKNAYADYSLEMIDAEDIKSVVVTFQKIYLSPVSVMTLKKRMFILEDHLQDVSLPDEFIQNDSCDCI
ncbi:extracellular matrix regulator RemB [Alicyclobacillus tolerans]|uniref:DUF370 domain-containing protein n=1 Tax=Alicyclobacillus tolerans TaxID=90970 RepID=A0ABT9LUG0_9BACL|nr:MULTISPECIES: extracellular matrix/biofilm biosynthesis regulator RemA family protein [Alicyclobacillus]MDP9727910.1 hypothetical protein [Alicyclobacillus tengchongensis]QRF22251.1 DUF370 domain-containing protein [Alicyclobacillus sp. TC]